MNVPKKVAVIGAGPMGLMVALDLAEAGHQVDIFEKDDRIGGMSASFDFDGVEIERYYHFICKTDYALFSLLDRLGISDKLFWTNTKMGYYYQGELYTWGSPFALLKFPKLSLIDKFRYAVHVLATKRIRKWDALDKENATSWLRRWLGDKAYDTLWERTFHLKFFEYADNLSAAWIGTRIKRIALSRESLLKESLGYLKGGSKVLLDAMAERVSELGGRIHLKNGVDRVVIESNRVSGVLVDGQFRSYDNVVSTSPIQYVPYFAPDLQADYKEKIKDIENIPVACVILKLKHPVSENFWMNISDDGIDIPGIIEYSNLNPDGSKDGHIVYAPFYMPKTHPKWSLSNGVLIDEVIGYLGRINPSFREEWLISSHCHRYEFAQTICPPGFQAMLPPMEAPTAGFFMADTSYYYPEDRSISESIQVGAKLAALVKERG